MADTDPDVRWMSYAEAARALGVNPESVARRLRRGGWARTRGNDGKPRVAVPVSALPVPVIVRASAPDGVPVIVPDNPDGEAAALREALARERERADKAEAERDAARAEREAARIAAAAAEGEARGLREALAEARRPFWRRWLGMAALCAGSTLLPAIVSAQVDPHSATWAMPGCRAAVAEPRRPADYQIGYCTGVVSGVSFMAFDVCMPGGVTMGQMMRVVVHYIDARPARQHESFEKLVAEALRSAWPCPR